MFYLLASAILYLTGSNFNLLIADAGSPGGVLSQMYLLAELMRRLRSELDRERDLLPSDYFHLIGGSGIGA